MQSLIGQISITMNCGIGAIIQKETPNHLKKLEYEIDMESGKRESGWSVVWLRLTWQKVLLFFGGRTRGLSIVWIIFNFMKLDKVLPAKIFE